MKVARRFQRRVKYLDVAHQLFARMAGLGRHGTIFVYPRGLAERLDRSMVSGLLQDQELKRVQSRASHPDKKQGEVAMKSARKITVHIALVLCAGLMAMAQPQAPASKTAQPPSLDAIVAEIQQSTQNTNLDLGRLRIDRWKAD